VTATGPGDLLATTFDLDAGTAWVTLNRPDAANARNQAMRDDLSRIYDFVATSEDVDVMVLTGAGDRFFCAGMDLKESAGGETSDQRRARLRGSRDIDALAQLPVPTIAAINGYALGGGLEMALACDLRICADEAQLGLPELSHGLVPGGGGTQRLPRLIGPAATLELLYLARRLSGPDALAYGIVNRSVPRAALRQSTQELAQAIAKQPRAALRSAKQLVLRSSDTPLAEGLKLELEALLDLLDQRDAAK
jgi:methylglutaconyl-CoA hydratase